MPNKREDFLKLASVRTQDFKVPSLNNYEIKMKELTVSESKQFSEIMNKDGIQQAINYACRCTCVEPEFFTDEELENLGSNGVNARMEIYMEIPLIGKNDEEREAYKNRIAELSKEKEEEKKSVEEVKKGK